MIGVHMPTSKKPRKRTAAKKKAADNVVTFPPEPRGMEGVMASMFGSRNRSPLGQAQELMYDAWETANPKQRIKLAKQAIEVSPLCADAYNLLAEENAKTLAEAIALYHKAVAAGEAAIGPKDFKEFAGHFWGFHETRPYMRARHGLGEALWAAGDKEGAIKNFQEMLELNPGDNQGIRYVLAAKLLDSGRTKELKKLLKTYEDDYSADIQYTRALIAFSEGASNANEIAKEALDTNKHVPSILSGKKKSTPLGNYITMGGEDEASGYVEIFGRAWKKTPGSIEWLCEVTTSL
jgi:tetratricopeptide (TPR) repeat protein